MEASARVRGRDAQDGRRGGFRKRTWFADFSEERVRDPVGVLGRVAVADVDQQALVPHAQLLRRAQHRHRLHRARLQRPRTGGQREDPRAEGGLQDNTGESRLSNLEDRWT